MCVDNWKICLTIHYIKIFYNNSGQNLNSDIGSNITK